MPPSAFQVEVLRTIADNRAIDSHVGGGIALNWTLPRLSFDIDIFHDSDVAVARSAEADALALVAAGFDIEWLKRFPTMLTARISRGTEQTSIDWVRDSSVRFFPVQPHAELKCVLHPFDLATNKALAAVARREPRDALDLVTINETRYPLGIVAWAAVGKDEGFSPSLLLDLIGRFARYRDDDLDRIESRETVTAAELSIRLKTAIWDAQVLIETLPPETVGHAFLGADGDAVVPDLDRLGDYTLLAATPGGGVWPIDPSIPVTGDTVTGGSSVILWL